jgi:hypothetical protein
MKHKPVKKHVSKRCENIDSHLEWTLAIDLCPKTLNQMQ